MAHSNHSIWGYHKHKGIKQRKIPVRKSSRIYRCFTNGVMRQRKEKVSVDRPSLNQRQSQGSISWADTLSVEDYYSLHVLHQSFRARVKELPLPNHVPAVPQRKSLVRPCCRSCRTTPWISVGLHVNTWIGDVAAPAAPPPRRTSRQSAACLPLRSQRPLAWDTLPRGAAAVCTGETRSSQRYGSRIPSQRMDVLITPNTNTHV